jgi:hypothetical protein
MTTDALAVTKKGENIFAAKATKLANNGKVLLDSSVPVTCDFSASGVKYYIDTDSKITMGAQSKPGTIEVNGKKSDFTWNDSSRTITIALPAGEGSLVMK